jgi:uncharacterized protein (TIGR00730 family)
MAINSVAVFCGSKSGTHPSYMAAATQLGNVLAQKNITLIYGGGGVGIMGAVATAVLQQGGHVTGIIPQHLLSWEAQHKQVANMIVTPDMHERKKLLYQKADAAIILPGGFGTLDELFEILTWNQLKLHKKNIFIVNTNGFYTALLAHCQKMFTDGFLYNDLTTYFTTVTTVDDLLPLL